VAGGAAAATAREMLRLATRGGAAVLGRDDIGSLAPGMAADLIAFRLDDLALAGGAVHDPLASLVFCRPAGVYHSIVNGEHLIDKGDFTLIDIERVVAGHNRLARALVSG